MGFVVDAGSDGLVRDVRLWRDGVVTGYGSPQEAAPYLVAGDRLFVGTGDWPGDMTVPSGVEILGADADGVARIIGTVTIGDSTLRNLIIRAPAAQNCLIINGAGGGAAAELEAIRTEGQGSGIGIQLVTGEVHVSQLQHASGTLTKWLDLASGTTALVQGLIAWHGAFTGTMLDVRGSLDLHNVSTHVAALVGLHVHSGGSVGGESVEIEDVTTGVLIEDGTYGLDSAKIEAVTTGVRVAHDSAVIDADGGRYSGGTTDLLVDPAITGARIRAANMTGSTFVGPEAWIASGKLEMVTNRSGSPDDQIYWVQSQMGVGNRWKGRTASFGEGGPTIDGMIVLTNTNLEIGSWADITAQLASAEGSTATLLSALTAGASLYVGGGHAFPAIELDLVTATALGAGELIWEYWDGGAWVADATMAVQANDQHLHRGQAWLEQAEVQDVRFRVIAASKTVNSVPGYWVRLRVVTAITTAPVAEQCRLHTNSSVNTASGFPVLFGASEAILPLEGITVGQLEAVNATAPLTTDVDWADRITFLDAWTLQDNQSIALGQRAALPEGIDTSKELDVTVVWLPNNANVGSVRLEALWSVASPGDVLDGTAVADNEVKGTVTPGVAKEAVSTTFSIDLCEASPGQAIGIAVERDATPGSGDTYVGNVTVVDFRVTGVWWR
jgi:hypothetical protein